MACTGSKNAHKIRVWQIMWITTEQVASLVDFYKLIK